MRDYSIELKNNEPENAPKFNLKEWLYEQVFYYKLNTPFGVLVLLALSVFVGFAIYKTSYKTAGLMLGVLIGAPALIASMFNLRFGIITIITLSFFLLGIKRAMGDVPLGLAMDIMISLMFFGIILKQITEKDWSFANNQITRWVLVWIVFNLAQAANPWAESRLAWVYTVRSIAGFMAMYFIILYSLRNISFATILLKLWIFLALLGALYGFYQEYIGFQQFEMNWIMADKRRYGLLWIMGRFRKFSFFSDPMVFGFVMAYTAIFCGVLLVGPWRKVTKMGLAFCVVVMVMAMVYSGTRAAYVLLPVGMFFFATITMKRNIMIVSAIAFMIGLVVVNIPTSNPNLVRFQTAFRPNEDESYKVRKRNQAFIQPYIQMHFMGGGLGSVGTWGEKFSPHSPLSKFPPDSGYVRIAVEMGWLGLGLYLAMLFVILRVGVKNHFRIKDPLLKSYSLALLCVLYTLVIANFPQEAIGQLPTNLIFFLIVALLNKLRDFDEQKQRYAKIFPTAVDSTSFD